MTHLNLDLQPEAIRQLVLRLASAPEGIVLESAGQAIACLVSPPKGAPLPEEEWSPKLNERRGELLDRKYDGNLSPAEAAELALLQEVFERYVDKVAPLPLEAARALHQELLEKAAQHQRTNTP